MAAVPTIGRADGVAVRPASADAHAELLYERLYDRVYGYCLYQLGSREEAEDAAQVTFVQALRGLRRGVVPRFDAGWVFAIAKNVCIERYQTRGRHRQREVLIDPTVLELASAAEEPPNGDVARLSTALKQLPQAQREAVLLREWRGLSYREIAAEMGLSVSAVETLIFRARRSMAQHLTEEPDTRRSLAHAFVLGPIAAALKGVLGGSAAKLAAAAALAVAAALTGSALLASAQETDTPRRPAVVLPRAVPLSGEALFLRPAAVPRPRAEADSRGAPERAQKPGVSKAKEGTALGSPSNPVADVVGQAEGVLDPIVQPVQPVVDQVESTLEPILQAAPQLPDVELPALETELQLP